MQGDMLLLFFVMTVGAVFKVAGALSADSPYSNVGAQRELLQMLAYEPLVILTFVGMSAATGSFVLVHTLKYANSAATPTVRNPNLPVRCKGINTGNTNNISMSVTSMSGISWAANSLAE